MTNRANGWAMKASTIKAIVKLRGQVYGKFLKAAIETWFVPIQAPKIVNTNDIKKTLHTAVISIALRKFKDEKLDEVLAAATIKPAIMQVELHPYFQQSDLKARLAPYGTRL